MFDEQAPLRFRSQHLRLVRAAHRLLGSEAEAEDAVQDSYLRALEAEDGGRAPPDVVQAWLTTVMQHLAIDRLRRRRWMRDWMEEAVSQAVEPEVHSAETAAALAQQTDQALRRLAARLSPTEGAALLLHEVFEASFGEIAQACGKTEAACRQQSHRALLRLRQPGDDVRVDDDDARSAFQVYRHALHNRDLRPLLAMLQQPATRAEAHFGSADAKASPRAVCQVTHIGGQLALSLVLEGQFVCALPLGARPAETVESG